MIVSYVPVIFAIIAVLVAIAGLGFLVWGVFAEDSLISWLGTVMMGAGLCAILIISLITKNFTES